MHVLGLNVVCDVMALPGLVIANQTEKGICSQLLHVLIQTALHFIIVCNTYSKDVKNMNIFEANFLFHHIY